LELNERMEFEDGVLYVTFKVSSLEQ
jgi:hypothetical protein